MLAITAIVGVLVGGLTTLAVTQPDPMPEPIPITLATFPRELMGTQRNDLELREEGFQPTVDRLDEEFEEQLAAFRFAYGGDGATFGYGFFVELTIVDGIIAPGLPRDGEVDLAGGSRETRRMISLRSPATSCTFEPRPQLDPEFGIVNLGDFSSTGRSECTLVDRERNLSLRLSHNYFAPDSYAFEAAELFGAALENLHSQLVE